MRALDTPHIPAERRWWERLLRLPDRCSCRIRPMQSCPDWQARLREGHL